MLFQGFWSKNPSSILTRSDSLQQQLCRLKEIEQALFVITTVLAFTRFSEIISPISTESSAFSSKVKRTIS